MMEDLRPYNENKKREGYWEYYYANGKLHCKGCFDNGIQVGLWEYYSCW